MTSEETQGQIGPETIPCRCGQTDCSGEAEVVTLDEVEDWLDGDEVKYGRWEKGAIVAALGILFVLYETLGVLTVLGVVCAGGGYVCYANMMHMKPRIMDFKDVLKQARKVKASKVPFEEMPDEVDGHARAASGGNAI